jgi:RimJ/RimL family protein N-acetyltransferase
LTLFTKENIIQFRGHQKMKEEFRLKDGRNVTIKRLKVEDYEKNQNYEFVHNWLNQVSKYLGRDFPPEELEKDREYFYKKLKGLEHFFVVGAKYNEKIVGTASLELNLNSKKFKHVATWGISVNQDFQNQGLGERLLEVLENIAKSLGIKKLEAEFIEGNSIARNLYTKKLKYSIEGRKKYSVLLSNGTYVDKIHIGKILDENLIKELG